MAYSSLFSLSLLILTLCVGAIPISLAHWDVKSFAEKLTDHVFPQDGSKDKDLIIRLPTQPGGVNFTQHSGYIAVDPTGTRNLFYYLAQSSHSPDTKPLILWLGGALGTSSVGAGAFEQNGPFQITLTGTTLKKNMFSWQRVSNMLYVDSPVGVGFSYTKNATDYCTADEMAAIDNYRFLVNWLERFPEYKSRDLYLAGNDYAGYALPQLADVISFYNKQQQQHVINLKGVILGNPALDTMEDTRGRFAFLQSHGFISDELAMNVTRVCRCRGCGRSFDCYKALDAAIPFLPSYYVNNIYELPCKTGQFTPGSLSNDAQEIYGCGTIGPLTKYLNLPHVQNAMHVKNATLKGPYLPFNIDTEKNYNGKYNSSIPILKNVIDAGIPIWIYSGDFDARNPVTSTMYSLRLLHLRVEDEWRGWYSTETELAGMTLTYQGNVTFATVRAAGHSVPVSQPERSSLMIGSMIQGRDLPRSPYFQF